MKKIIIGLISISAILLVSTNVFAHQGNENQCNEHNPENCPSPSVICGNGEHEGNPHCVTPTPTFTPTPTPEKCEKTDDEWAIYVPCPTVTVTPTPTVEETLTPTPTIGCDEDCVTPTSTPSATVTVTVSVNSGGPGDGKSDGRSDGRSDGNSSSMFDHNSPFDGRPVGWK